MGTSKNDDIVKKILSIEDGYSVDTRLFCKYLRETDQVFCVDALSNWAGTLAKSGYAAATINRRISGIKSRLRYLFDEAGDDAFNVLARFSSEQSLKKVKGFKINSRAVDPSKVLSEADVKILLEKSSERLSLIIEFLYTTGCRVSEALGSLQNSITRHREFVTIRIIGKGSKERVVKITVGLYQRMDKTFKGKTFLFETELGGRYDRHHIEKQVRNVGFRYLGRRVTPHYFRHSFATHMIEKTGKIKGVSKYLGHGSTTVTMDMYNQEQLDFLEIPHI